MLIVCPNCSTSYMIDPTSVGPAGRAVRCARCKTTWFAGASQAVPTAAPGGLPKTAPTAAPSVSAFVDGVIAEAEAQSNSTQQQTPPRPSEASAPPMAMNAPAETRDFDVDPTDGSPPAAGADSTPAAFGEPRHDLGYNGDFDSVTIDNAPSLVPSFDHEAPHDGQSAESELEDIETFAVRRERLKARRQKSKRMSRWTAIILVLFAFNVALIGARSEVVRYLPQTASLFAAIGLPVNLRHLKFDNVKIVKEAQDGVSILIVEGQIENTADKPTEVPRLRFAARNATGQEVYTWTALPDRSILGAHESLPFHSRLAAPPADATDVMVRFFNAQDAAAGAK